MGSCIDGNPCELLTTQRADPTEGSSGPPRIGTRLRLRQLATVLGVVSAGWLLVVDDPVATAIAVVGCFLLLRSEDALWSAAWLVFIGLACVGALWPLPVVPVAIWLLVRWRTNGMAESWSLHRLLGLPFVLFSAGLGLATFIVLRIWLSQGRALWFDFPLSFPLLLVAGLLAAALNGVLEEFLWRGALIGSMVAVRIPMVVLVGAQALSFGMPHLTGIPSGAVGLLGATALGFLLGVVRFSRWGLAGCVVAHIVADGVIFLTLILGYR